MSIAEVYDTTVTRRPLVPPAPPRAPDDMTAFGRMRAMRNSPIETWGRRAYEDDIIRGRFFGRSSFILNTPDAIRHVLVDNYENYTRTPAGIRVLRPMLGEGLLIAEGRAWKHQRRTLAPAFTPRAVMTLAPTMIAVTDETIAKLKVASSGPVDLRETMQRMTLEIAGRTMFSFGMDRHGATLRNFVMEYGETLARPHMLDLLLPLGWPSPQDFRRARFRKRWTAFVGQLMAERRAAGKNDNAPARDLFDLMEAARDPETGEAFTDAQLGDQVATMILAGHETTATALFWALYLLALDPPTQEQLAAEVSSVAAAGTLDIERLKFTRAVMDETMRLYPPAFLIARAADGPDTISGLPVRKHDVILIAPWLLHRHEKLWRDPNAFVPARFMTGTPPDRFAYLPFGVGARVCIGAHFALVEATLALARIIGTFRVALADKEPVMPIGVVTTQPNRSPMFAITAR
ncbi:MULTISPECIES: cytochrome P450 [unclassified Bradyrhizobium]|uniref:cytochrome P450 n=1 Tax=unclassified Bradyrhizobium TaxID=2631580 RepID=UPI0024798116|nr:MULTISPECIES: cytochrome P450 [unclassified Bradyrhizobium]WGS20892.1 cytochrome P450 [Bradyrhizobium sp. ISRA463]WGS27791.1 cytochrome P450 [Bradyrhizobium sp. ISRA464]